MADASDCSAIGLESASGVGLRLRSGVRVGGSDFSPLALARVWSLEGSMVEPEARPDNTSSCRATCR